MQTVRAHYLLSIRSILQQASASVTSSVFVSCSLCSGAERAPAKLCGRDQRSTRPWVHQGGPSWQAGRTDQVQSQWLEGCLRPHRCFVRRTRGVQHWMVSSCFHFQLCINTTTMSAVTLKAASTSRSIIKLLINKIIIKSNFNPIYIIINNYSSFPSLKCREKNTCRFFRLLHIFTLKVCTPCSVCLIHGAMLHSISFIIPKYKIR